MLRAAVARARRAAAAAPRAAAQRCLASAGPSGSSVGDCVGLVSSGGGARGSVGLVSVNTNTYASNGRAQRIRHYADARGTRPRDVVEATRPLIANMIVERLPVVMPLPEDWELEYQSWSMERRKQFLQQLPEDLVDPKGEFEEIVSSDELRFAAASRETEADRNGDQKTMKRKLDQFLFLVVRDRETKTWGFPTGVADENDGNTTTMRQLAKNAMDDAIGVAVTTYLVGNAPMGHFAASATKTGGEGTHFYLRAQWLEGDLDIGQGRFDDFKWLTKVREIRWSTVRILLGPSCRVGGSKPRTIRAVDCFSHSKESLCFFVFPGRRVP